MSSKSILAFKTTKRREWVEALQRGQSAFDPNADSDHVDQPVWRSPGQVRGSAR
jgi:hypothetical protein